MYFYTPVRTVRPSPARLSGRLVTYGGGRRQVPVPVLLVRRGLAGPSRTQIAGGAMSGASIGFSTAQQTGSTIAGAAAGGLMAAAPFTGPAAPFLIAAASLIAPIASLFRGCGATCTQATEYANQAEVALTRLRDEYFAQPVHWASTQRATLGYMDQVFASLEQACGNPALGAAGQRCISERLIRGAPAPWCPTGTGCDWITALRDPVANDTAVVPDPAPAGSLENFFSGSGGGGSGAGLSDLLLPAGLILAGLML